MHVTGLESFRPPFFIAGAPGYAEIPPLRLRWESARAGVFVSLEVRHLK